MNISGFFAVPLFILLLSVREVSDLLKGMQGIICQDIDYPFSGLSKMFLKSIASKSVFILAIKSKLSAYSLPENNEKSYQMKKLNASSKTCTGLNRYDI